MSDTRVSVCVCMYTTAGTADSEREEASRLIRQKKRQCGRDPLGAMGVKCPGLPLDRLALFGFTDYAPRCIYAYRRHLSLQTRRAISQAKRREVEEQAGRVGPHLKRDRMGQGDENQHRALRRQTASRRFRKSGDLGQMSGHTGTREQGRSQPSPRRGRTSNTHPFVLA